MKKKINFFLLAVVLLLSVSSTSVFAKSNDAPSYKVDSILAFQDGRPIGSIAVNSAQFDLYTGINVSKQNTAYSNYWTIEYGGKIVNKSEVIVTQVNSGITAHISVGYKFPKAGNYTIKFWMKPANTNAKWAVAASQVFKAN